MTITAAPPTSERPVAHTWAELSAALTGALLRPEDDGYAVLATPWNVAVPTKPAAVVRAANAEDVVLAVRWADQHGLRVDVRATGHGAEPTDGRILLIHTADLDELVVDPEGWARVGAGVRWDRVIEAAAPYGLAPVCGSAPGVGVVGFLTGGGVGPAARSLGVGSDRVRAFEVVTGDGVLRRASPTENPALFWGLCGGKGALGVVTAVEIDLVPLSHFYGGAVYFDGSDLPEIIHAWQQWLPSVPEAGTSSLAILQLPAAASVPPPLAGRMTVAVRFVWTGSAEEGARVVAPLLDVAEPVLGGFGVLPYAAIGSVHADPVDPMPVTESAQLLSELDAVAVETLIEVAGPESGSPQFLVELRQLGGAVARRPERGDALSHRGAAYALLTIGIGVPPLVGPVEEHAAAVAAAMAPWTTGGGFPNFGGPVTAESRARIYDPATLSRLTSLAATYDPRDVLAGAAALM